MFKSFSIPSWEFSKLDFLEPTETKCQDSSQARFGANFHFDEFQLILEKCLHSEVNVSHPLSLSLVSVQKVSIHLALLEVYLGLLSYFARTSEIWREKNLELFGKAMGIDSNVLSSGTMLYHIVYH